MDTTSIWIILAFFTMCITMMLKTRYTIKTVTLSSDTATDEEISEMFKWAPASAWKIHLAKSFHRLSADYSKVLREWQPKVDLCSETEDLDMLSNLFKDTTLPDCYNRLKRLPRPIIRIMLLFKSPNELSKKLFGKEIQKVYSNYYILVDGLKELKSRKIFTYKEAAIIYELCCMEKKNPDKAWDKIRVNTNFAPIFTEKLINNAKNKALSLNIS